MRGRRVATAAPAGAGDAGSDLLPGEAALGNTDFGTPGYGGPCPPPGTTHRYVVTVYALDDRLAIPENAPGAVVCYDILARTLGKATLMARYGR